MDKASHSLPTDVFGHPRGLMYLCFAEGWERFSFFGMQALLVLYMTHHLLRPGHIEHVVGFAVFRSLIEHVTGPLTEGALASQVFGLYAGFVYLTPLIGGFVADRWLGRTLTVTIGAILMSFGHFLMAFEWSFLPALMLLLVGVGGFKGNITSQVSGLYRPGDLRRATAYQWFQFSISTAVIVSGLVCGTLGEKVGWHYGFGAAGVGMLIAAVLYLHGRRWLPAAQSPRSQTRQDLPERLSARDWKTILLLAAIVPMIAGAQVGNQQMFNAFLVWSEKTFDLHVAGFEMPVTWLLSANAALSSVLMVLMIGFWRFWRRRGHEPGDIVKMALGATFLSIGPLLLALGSLQLAGGAKISIAWGMAFEVFNEIGFVIMIPANLALFSGAAPKRVQGMMIGVYFLAFLAANLAVGWLGGLLEKMDSFSFWMLHAAIAGTSALLLAIVAKWGRGLLNPQPESADRTASSVP